MKTNPTAAIESAFTFNNSTRAEIVSLEKFGSANSESLATLERTARLDDPKALDAVARAQTIAELLPRRMAHLEEQFTLGQSQLLAALDNFISQHAGPKRRELAIRIKKKIREALIPHFSSEVELDRAVEASDAVREIDDLSWPLTITASPHDGLEARYNRILEAWEKLSAIEAALS